jgi:voltage-gated potassium channel
MKEEEEQFERVRPLRPGDVILRRKRPRRKLRVLPNIPAMVVFLKDVSARTPLVPLLLSLVGLWLLFSLALYLAEGGVSEQITSYRQALWWSFGAMHTMGVNNPGPVTPVGMVIGGIWGIIGTVIFFGVIIAIFYAYFMRPRQRPSRELITAIQYNLGELEGLSAGELETLRDATTRVIDAQISKLKEKSSS